LIKKPKSQDVNDYVMPQIRQIKDPFIADNILVPLDFSPASKQAFYYAAYLASHYNSTIYTLTVFDKKSKERGDDAKLHTAVTVRGKKVHLWQAFPRLFNTSAVNPARIRVKRLLLDGDPSARIESVVQKKEIDLVIMGTNGKTGLEHLLVGSVAEKVLKSVNCPVMTIRARNSSAA
jgi:nucleotide-binding universal stress UspA family protein